MKTNHLLVSVVAFSLILLASGCASAERIRGLPDGMTQDQVRASIGTPVSVAEKNGKQIWIYQPLASSCAVVFDSGSLKATACSNGDAVRTPASTSATAQATFYATQAAIAQAAEMTAAQTAMATQTSWPAAIMRMR